MLVAVWRLHNQYRSIRVEENKREDDTKASSWIALFIASRGRGEEWVRTPLGSSNDSRVDAADSPLPRRRGCVIGHSILAGKYIAEYHDSLK